MQANRDYRRHGNLLAVFFIINKKICGNDYAQKSYQSIRAEKNRHGVYPPRAKMIEKIYEFEFHNKFILITKIIMLQIFFFLT